MAEAANEKTSPEHKLRAELERESNTCKRQELLRALWRLGKDYRSGTSQSSAVTSRAPVGHTTHDRDSTNHRSPMPILVE